jgi:hypothetical protein
VTINSRDDSLPTLPTPILLQEVIVLLGKEGDRGKKTQTKTNSTRESLKFPPSLAIFSPGAYLPVDI